MFSGALMLEQKTSSGKPLNECILSALKNPGELALKAILLLNDRQTICRKYKTIVSKFYLFPLLFWQV